MNKALTFIAGIACIGFSACNLEPKGHAEEIQKMEDTLFKSFETVNRVTVEVKNDFGKEVNITLGDQELYNATEEKRQLVVNKTTEITRHIFAEGTPKKGKVIFVKEENTILVDKSAAKTYDMPLDKK